jgi:hypothetical protein
LIKAFDEAVSRGYNPASPHFKRYVATLSPTHEDYSVRYLEGSGPVLPSIPETLKLVNSLILDINNQCDPLTRVELEIISLP